MSTADRAPRLQKFQELGVNRIAAPAFHGDLVDAPADDQLFLVEMNDVHLGLLPNGWAGVYEGTVPPARQGNSIRCGDYSDRSFSS